MSALASPVITPSSDWILKFRYGDVWYPLGAPFLRFADAWEALTILSKWDRGTPIERCIVKSFN